MEREKGAASAACGACGTDLDLVVQRDGSVAASACSRCYASGPVEAPAEEPAAPELASLFMKREMGSEPEEEDEDA